MKKYIGMIFRLIKYLLKLCLISFIAIFCFKSYEHYWDDTHYLNFTAGDLTTKLRIPEEIVKSKCCNKFFAWQSEKVHPMFIYHPCPWGKYKPIRNIYLDGTWLAIPRSYLFAMSKSELDGPAKAVLLDFKFPSLEPGIDPYSVSVFMQAMSAEEQPKKEVLKRIYSQFLHIVIETFEGLLYRGKVKDNYKIIPLGFDENLQRKKYRVEKHFIYSFTGEPSVMTKYVWTNDNPERPEDFVVCEREEELGKTRSYCDSLIFYKNFYVEYRFRVQMLNQHNAIRQELIKLLTKWEKDYEKQNHK